MKKEKVTNVTCKGRPEERRVLPAAAAHHYTNRLEAPSRKGGGRRGKGKKNSFRISRETKRCLKEKTSAVKRDIYQIGTHKGKLAGNTNGKEGSNAQGGTETLRSFRTDENLRSGHSLEQGGGISLKQESREKG